MTDEHLACHDGFSSKVFGVLSQHYMRLYIIGLQVISNLRTLHDRGPFGKKKKKIKQSWLYQHYLSYI